MLWDLTLAMTHPGFRMTPTWLQTGRALSRASTRGSLRIMKLRKMNYSLISDHLPIILSWSLQQQINEEGLRLLIGQWCYRLKSRAAVGTPWGHGLSEWAGLQFGGVPKQTSVVFEGQAMKIMGPLPRELHPSWGGMYQQRWRRRTCGWIPYSPHPF